MEKTIGTSTLEVAVRVVSLALVLALAAWPARSAELPPAIQADRHLMQAERQIGDGDYAAALASLDRILALQAEHDLEIPDAFWFKHGQVSHEAGLHAQAVESVTRYLVVAGQGGEHYLAALELLDVAEAEAAEARVVAEREAQAVAAAAAAVARGEPLEMVVIPAGRFRMGCLSGDDDCHSHEKPVREVAIASFALSKHEVTFAQWDACVSGGGCGGHRPDDSGLGPRRPPGGERELGGCAVVRVVVVAGDGRGLPVADGGGMGVRGAGGDDDEVQLGERDRRQSGELRW